MDKKYSDKSAEELADEMVSALMVYFKNRANGFVCSDFLNHPWKRFNITFKLYNYYFISISCERDSLGAGILMGERVVPVNTRNSCFIDSDWNKFFEEIDTDICLRIPDKYLNNYYEFEKQKKFDKKQQEILEKQGFEVHNKHNSLKKLGIILGLIICMFAGFAYLHKNDYAKYPNAIFAYGKNNQIQLLEDEANGLYKLVDCYEAEKGLKNAGIIADNIINYKLPFMPEDKLYVMNEKGFYIITDSPLKIVCVKKFAGDNAECKRLENVYGNIVVVYENLQQLPNDERGICVGLSNQ